MDRQRASRVILDQNQLEQLIANFPSLRIALIGDLFLDRYLDLEPGVVEHSIETGLEAFQVTRIRNAAGALGTVINNLSSLGVGTIVPIAVIGDDGQGDDLCRELSRASITLDGIVRCPKRLTPTYTKPMRQDADGHWQELNRIDIRDRQPLTSASEARLIERLRTLTEHADALIVLDQIVESNWGIINDNVRSEVRQLANRRPDLVVYSDSRSHLDRFDFGILKCNRHELTAISGLDASAEPSSEPFIGAARRLSEKTKSTVFCTLGERGVLVQEQNRTTIVPALSVEPPVDIVGAGDSANSGIVASLLSGATPIQAGFVGNLTASITVKKQNETGVASPNELRAQLQHLANRT